MRISQAPGSGEIVGLKHGEDGRSCTCHDVCGESLFPGDLVRFRLELRDSGEEVFKVMKIEDGTEVCHVGFLPKYYVKSTAHRERHINKFAQVLDFLANSDNSADRAHDARNYGVARFMLLDDIPLFE